MDWTGVCATAKSSASNSCWRERWENAGCRKVVNRGGDQCDERQCLLRGLGGAQSVVKPGGVVQQTQQPAQGEAEQGHDDDALFDMVAFVMAQFVGEHGFDLRCIQLVDQGVEKDDALGFPEAGKVGVAVRGSGRAIHDEYAVAGEAVARQQVGDALFQVAVGQGAEAVEPGGDEGRVGPTDEHLQRHPQCPQEQPPVREAVGQLHYPQGDADGDAADDDGEQHLFAQIGEVQFVCHAVEAVAFFYAEHAHEGQGHLQHRVCQIDAEQKRQGQQPLRLQRTGPEVFQRRQATGVGEHEETARPRSTYPMCSGALCHRCSRRLSGVVPG